MLGGKTFIPRYTPVRGNAKVIFAFRLSFQFLNPPNVQPFILSTSPCTWPLAPRMIWWFDLRHFTHQLLSSTALLEVSQNAKGINSCSSSYSAPTSTEMTINWETPETYESALKFHDNNLRIAMGTLGFLTIFTPSSTMTQVRPLDRSISSMSPLILGNIQIKLRDSRTKENARKEMSKIKEIHSYKPSILGYIPLFWETSIL